MSCFLFHKWGRWSMPIQTYENAYKQQWRVCKTCNKANFRTMGWDRQVSINAVQDAIRGSLIPVEGENEK